MKSKSLLGQGVFIVLSIMLSTTSLHAFAILKNVQDFNNQPFVHIDFETSSGQSNPTDIDAFLQAQSIGQATYGGSRLTPTNSSLITENSGSSLNGGFDGGAVSGTGHLQNSNFNLTLNFGQAVDAFGFFVGGLHFLSNTNFTVTFEDNSTSSVSVAHLALAQDGSPSSAAISGFIGVDSDGGQLIKSFTWFHSSDTHSIDDIFFGTANFSNTVGLQPLAENGASGGNTVAFPLSGNGAVPEPSSWLLLLGAFSLGMLKLRK